MPSETLLLGILRLLVGVGGPAVVCVGVGVIEVFVAVENEWCVYLLGEVPL